MDIDIIDIIKILQTDRKARNIHPAIVLLNEIQTSVTQQVLEELRTLVKQGKVKHHKILNGHAFSINDV